MAFILPLDLPTFALAAPRLPGLSQIFTWGLYVFQNLTLLLLEPCPPMVPLCTLGNFLFFLEEFAATGGAVVMSVCVCVCCPSGASRPSLLFIFASCCQSLQDAWHLVDFGPLWKPVHTLSPHAVQLSLPLLLLVPDICFLRGLVSSPVTATSWPPHS